MSRHIAWIVLGSLVAASGCDKKDSGQPPAPSAPKSGADLPKAGTDAPAGGGAAAAFDAGKKAAAAAAQSAATAFTDTKEKFTAAAETKIKEFTAQFDTLKQKASSAAPTVKPLIEPVLKDLESQLANAKTQLETVKSTAADSWQKVSADFQGTLGRMTDSFKSAMDQFGK